MFLSKKLQMFVELTAYAVALNLVDLFSEEKHRGPNFVWKDFFKERMFTVTLNQVYIGLSGNQYKRYEKQIEGEVEYYVNMISNKYVNIFENLGVIKCEK